MPSQKDGDMGSWQKTLLKKSLSKLSPVGLSALSGRLSTIYAANMVSTGHLAVSHDLLRDASASRWISRRTRTALDHCFTNVSLALEEIRLQSEAIGEIESILEDAKRLSPSFDSTKK